MNGGKVSNASEELSNFFHFMWGETEGYVYLPTKDSNEEWKKVFYKWPVHEKAVVNYVLAATAEQKNVYFAPAIFKTPKPVREFVLGSNVIWTEFDGNAPNNWDAEDPSRLVGPPSLRVQSSTEDHQHVYWRLDEFCYDVDLIENVNRSLAYSLGADTSGWDANQVLRPPLTTNYKRNLPVFVLEDHGPTYKRNDFTGFQPIKQLVNSSVDDTNLPDVIDVIAKYQWDEDNLALVKKSAEELGNRDRSSALMRIGFYCAEKGMTDIETYAVLFFLDEKWGKFKKRDDRKKRLLDIVNKAKLKFPHAVAEPTFAGLLSESTPTEVNIKTVYGFDELIKLDEKITWMIDGLVTESGVGLIASEPGIGKTQFMLNLGMKVCLTKPFVGLQPMF